MECEFSQVTNANGGCKAAVVERTKVSWEKFRKCRDILMGRKIPTEDKGKDCKS